MTPEEIANVQTSFVKVVPIAETAADLFYGRLFEIAPQVKPMFKGDMKAQGTKLMAALGLVVKSLQNLDAVLPVARNLAIGHVAYGVRPDHYAPVGEALIWTLDKGLGDAFTPPVRSAWIAAYATLSGVMIAAAYPAHASGVQ